MKQSMKAGLFPWVTLLAGMVGFALQSWLFSSAQSGGLLPKNHIAGILSLLLLAGILALCLVAVKNAAGHSHRRLFPPSAPAAAGMLVAGIGLGGSAFALDAAGLLGVLLPVLGILCALCLIYSAYCRLKGVRPHYLAYGAVTVYLLFHVMAHCQQWGAQPQIQTYFFPLLAGLFLLLAGYYRTELSLLGTGHRRYVFFGQAALFCCCLSLAGGDRLFYLSAGIWLAADFCKLTDCQNRDA